MNRIRKHKKKRNKRLQRIRLNKHKERLKSQKNKKAYKQWFLNQSKTGDQNE